MARGYTAGVIITGNAEGAVKAVKLTEEQLSKLNTTQKLTSSITAQYTSQLKGFGDDLGKAAKQIGYVSAAFGAAAVGIAAFLKHGFEAGEQLAKTANTLNITTEALASLRLSAELAGVSTEQLDKLAGKMEVNIGKAALQGGKAAEAFTRLGLNVADLAKLPADQQMGKIADALLKVDNAAVRSALRVAIFGKAATDLAPVLDKGSKGIAEAAHQTQVLGLNLSAIETAKLDQAGDSMQLLGKGFEGFTQQLSLKFSGAVQAAADKMFNLSEETGGMRGVAEKAFNAIVSGLGVIADAVQRVYQGFEFISIGMQTLFNLVERAWLAYRHMTDQTTEGAMAELQIAQRAFDDATRNNSTIMESNYGKALARRLSEAKLAVELSTSQADADAKYAAAVADLDTDLTKTSAHLQRLLGDTSKWGETLVTVMGDAAAASDAQAAAAVAANKKVIGSNQEVVVSEADKLAAKKKAAAEWKKIEQEDDEFWRGIQQADLDVLHQVWKEQDDAAKKASKDQAAAAKEIQAFWEHATSRIDSAFADLWKGVFEGFDDFKSQLQDAFKQMLAELAHAAITKPIVLYFQQQLAGVGSVPGGTAGTGTAGAAGGAFGTLQSILGMGKGGGAAGGAGIGGYASSALSGLSQQAGSAISWVGQKLFDAGFKSVGSAIFNRGYDMTKAGFGGPSIFSAGNIIGGAIGGYAGNMVGNNVFNRQAGLPIGATVGGIAGAMTPLGPIGAGIGSFIGSLIDSAVGTDVKGQRVKLGISAGEAATGANTTVLGASGLSLSAIGKRLDKESGQALDNLLSAFQTMDAQLTQTARAMGMTVNFAGVNLTNPNVAGREAGANFFGSFRKGEVNAADVKAAADNFVKAWIAQIDGQLSARVRAGLKGVAQTADSIIEAFSGLSNIDKLLNLDVVGKTDEALKALGKANATLLEQYGDLNDKVLEVSSSYDGSVGSITALSDALTEQKTIAVQLAVAYRTAGQAIKSTFGSAIDFISEAVLTQEELYNKRREQISGLVAELSTTIDPEKIASISNAIDQLARGAFGLLSEDQQKGMAEGFVDFLKQAQDLAVKQITEGMAQLGSREAGVNSAADLELARAANLQQQQELLNQQAASTAAFSTAVDQFAGLPAQIQAAIEAAMAAGGSFTLDAGAEVNTVGGKNTTGRRAHAGN